MKNTIIGTLSLASVLLAANAYAAAESISLEVFKDTNGERFWQSEVKCDDSQDIKLIKKGVDSEQWCLSGAADVCFESKLIAAQKTCSGDYTNSVESNPAITPEALPETPIEVSETPTVAPETQEPEFELEIPDESVDEILYDYIALRKEKVELEGQRIKIQQEKLDLRRKEIELQKNALELN